MLPANIKLMKQLLIFTGLFSGLFTILGCSNFNDNKIIFTDSSGQIQKINPNEILMTIPTIENSFPEFIDKSDTNDLKILEDDWRQIEFISKNQKQLIDREIDSINYIYEHELHKGKDYFAYKKLHVRSLLANPVSISLDKVLKYLGDTNKKIAGISVNGNNGQVKNGFSISSKGINYYGITDNTNTVLALGWYGSDNNEALQGSVNMIAKFLLEEDLYLVDWINMKIIDEKNISLFFVPK